MALRITLSLILAIFASSALSAQPYPDYARSSIYVPVRDGTRLAVNIYRPADGKRAVAGKLPVIFVFTPYVARSRGADGKVRETALDDGLALRSLIRAGYVVAVADIRGKGASFGARRGFQDRTEAQDGYDLVQWLARQPFSTGEVGMVGCSYLGGTAFQTLSTRPPALKAAFIGATDFDKFDFVRKGGITAQFNTRPDEPLSVDLASLPVDADPDGTQLRDAVAQHANNTPMGPLWYGMPYRDSVSPLTGNAFWQEVAMYPYAGAIRDSGIATYFWGNWHDEPTGQVILAAANIGGKLLVGPGGHCATPPGFDFTGEVRRFFDHHLKGVDNGIDRDPRATYWVGKGREGDIYETSDALPGTRSQPLPMYFGGGGTLAPSGGGSGADSFTVDYDLPPAEAFAFWPGPMDEHGLSYTSAPLDRPLELLGFPVAHLTMKADKPDADVFVYLEEVRADGTLDMLSFGRLKLSMRKLSDPPYDPLGLPWHSGLSTDAQPLNAGETADLVIGLGTMSHTVPAGSRLRFVVAGADPRQRNLQDVMQSPPPQLTVLRGEGAGSRIDLPLRK